MSGSAIDISVLHRGTREEVDPARVISGCHFRKTAAEYDMIGNLV
jgi:hypothetical protein